MADLQSLVDRLHYDGTREYTDKQGDVAYLDSAPLQRPFAMPAAQRVVMLAVVIVAIIIGMVIVNELVISRWQETQSAESAVAENVQRQASIDTIPAMASLINLDDEAIRAAFAEAGYEVFDATELSNSNEMVIYKLPDDVSTSDAMVMLSQGIGSLNAQQASRLLAGSWYFASDRINTTSMVVRYADFSTADPETAVQNAILKEGFDPTTINDSGVDDSGNTYSSGTLDADGTSCTWKVSALPLDEMYSIKGLPEDACYVGVRVTVA